MNKFMASALMVSFVLTATPAPALAQLCPCPGQPGSGGPPRLPDSNDDGLNYRERRWLGDDRMHAWLSIALCNTYADRSAFDLEGALSRLNSGGGSALDGAFDPLDPRNGFLGTPIPSNDSMYNSAFESCMGENGYTPAN